MSRADTLDLVFSTLYDTLSGPPGPRDWSRFRPLFHPSAILTRVTLGANDRSAARLMSVDEYIESTTPFFETREFYEAETDRKVERFGSVAHVASAYESRWSPDEAPFMTGTNSVQLLHDGDRWWIVSMIWDNARFAELMSIESGE